MNLAGHGNAKVVEQSSFGHDTEPKCDSAPHAITVEAQEDSVSDLKAQVWRC